MTRVKKAQERGASMEVQARWLLLLTKGTALQGGSENGVGSPQSLSLQTHDLPVPFLQHVDLSQDIAPAEG